MTPYAWKFVKAGIVYGHPMSDFGVYINQIVPIRSATILESILWTLFKIEPK